MDRTLDYIDAAILNVLQENARTTQSDIAKAVGLAPSAVFERMRKLEAKGVIREYVAAIDPHVANRALLAFVAVRTTEFGPEQPAAKALAAIPEVLEVHYIAGEDCFLVKIRARDAEHLGDLLKTRVGRIKGVRSTRTTIVLGTLKESTQLPFPAAPASDEVDVAS